MELKFRTDLQAHINDLKSHVEEYKRKRDIRIAEGGDPETYYYLISVLSDRIVNFENLLHNGK